MTEERKIRGHRPGTCVVEYKSDKQRTQQISDWNNKGKKASPAGHFDQ